MVILMGQKGDKNQKFRLWVHETLILEVLLLILTDNLSIVTNGTKGPREYLHD